MRAVLPVFTWESIREQWKMSEIQKEQEQWKNTNKTTQTKTRTPKTKRKQKEVIALIKWSDGKILTFGRSLTFSRAATATRWCSVNTSRLETHVIVTRSVTHVRDVGN